MDLILSTALTSITYTIYLFKKNSLNELKSIKPFPSTASSSSQVEAAEAALEKEVTYYLEGVVSPIKPSEIITCSNSKTKAVILKNIIKRHSVRWSNFWKDWLPEVEVISISGQTVPFNVSKDGQPQVTIPKLSIQDVMILDLPVISDNYISQNRKSIVKNIMDYVSGERFSGIENMEQGYTLGHPITLIGKFKKPEALNDNLQVVTPSEINTIETVATALEPEDLLVQSTKLPVLITEFKDEEAYCIISPKTFKEIIEEEGKNVKKWKWVVIGSTSIVGGLIAFRLWRYYRRKRRAEAAAQHPEELERLQPPILPPPIENPNNPNVLDMLRDFFYWLIMDDTLDDPSYRPHPPITEYIPDPIPPSSSQEEPPTAGSTTPSAPKASSSSANAPTASEEDPAPPSDENTCVVCLTERREYAFLPCRHLCVCHNCVHYLEKCPLCRTPVQQYMKIFS